ncbi:MAG TPA: phospholipase D-like domain-containing protein [Jatrophihabitans sp.]|jgi:phosphatidylserine/phosphatidylglycerophosphate/cardiolipin synthase-like enzyme
MTVGDGDDANGDALAELVGRYFPPPSDTATHLEDTEWVPFVDGEHYFAELDAHLARAGAGDTVLASGLEINPYLDLNGRSDGEPGYAPLGRRFAEAAARGANVWLLIAGRVFPTSLPRSGLPFRDNAFHADHLRELTVDGAAEPPLQGRVQIDFSGALLGSNHQKTVVFHLDGELTSFVSGIDLAMHRWDAEPHDRLELDGGRWGWHDMATRLRGPAARRVWEAFRERWRETLTLPHEHWLAGPTDRRRLNPPGAVDAPPPAPQAAAVTTPQTAVRVLRSTFHRKVDSHLPFRRKGWDHVPEGGHQEIFTTLVTAISAARRYVYLEDQYLEESVGGNEHYELYPYLRAAADRGVKVILVGSGTRDPEDVDLGGLEINRELNDDLQIKIVDALRPDARANVAVHRLENCTVHAKLVLVDDVFANIGSANMFSRSMYGTDSEMSAAVVTGSDCVRDLRVAVWGEHLRTELTDKVRASLADLDLALGIWRPQWLPSGAGPDTWRRADAPPGFRPAERALTLVGPHL